MSLLTLYKLNLESIGPEVTGSGILIVSSADITGSGQVTGVGTPSASRRHRMLLEYEPILNRL